MASLHCSIRQWLYLIYWIVVWTISHILHCEWHMDNCMFKYVNNFSFNMDTLWQISSALTPIVNNILGGTFSRFPKPYWNADKGHEYPYCTEHRLHMEGDITVHNKRIQSVVSIIKYWCCSKARVSNLFFKPIKLIILILHQMCIHSNFNPSFISMSPCHPCTFNRRFNYTAMQLRAWMHNNAPLFCINMITHKFPAIWLS